MREVQQAMQIRQDLKPLYGLDILVYSQQEIEQRLSLGDSFLQEILAEGLCSMNPLTLEWIDKAEGDFNTEDSR